MSISDIATLACGKYTDHCNISDIFENLARNITEIESVLLELDKKDSKFITSLGPFYARRLLENVSTALIGRLDPFRLLVLKRIQMSASPSDIGRRWDSSINWQGDIFEQGIKDSLWKPNIKYNNICRAILGDYYGDIFWNETYKSILDSDIPLQYEKGDVLADYRTIPPEQFTIEIRKKISNLYSAISKGVHSEFIIAQGIIYDEITVLNLVSETMEYFSLLSLISHNIGTCICKIPLEQAVKVFYNIKERCDNYAKS